MISDDDLRDHFERQYAQGGPSAGMARAVLDLMDERDSATEELSELPEIIGAQPGETLEEQLKGVVDQYVDYERTSDDLRLLCFDAGLLARGDYETDPIPLIRMFLPIEGD